MKTEEWTSALLELADTTDIDDLSAVARRLAWSCTRLLPVTGAVVVLAGAEGKMEVAAAAPEWVCALPERAIACGEAGPALEAGRTATAVRVPDLRSTRWRWPEFTEAALQRGITAVCALPLRRGDDVLGALALYCDTSESATEVEGPAWSLTAAAGIGLWHWCDRQRLLTLTAQLQTALRSRIVIEQAKGALAASHKITITEAFNRLRGLARNNRLPIHDVARDVTDCLSSTTRDG